MKYYIIALAIVFGLFSFVACKECEPKQTFTRLVDLKHLERYQKYVKVMWCLYPDMPDNIEKFYAQIPTTSRERRFFEVDYHKNCRCDRRRESSVGYEDIRKKSIRNIMAIPSGKWQYLLSGLSCIGGPYIYQKWLGNSELSRPWAQVKRCITTKCSPKKTLKFTVCRATKTTKKIRVNYTKDESCVRI